jgi:hypothetical protein
MTMTREPLVLSPDWSDLVARDGEVELGVFGQAQLVAADLDLSAGDAATRESVSSFERLDPGAQRVAVEAARSTPIDPAVHRVLSAVTSNRLVHGIWQRTPPWYLPLEASLVSTLLGTSLQDGSMACLDARNDFATSQVTVTLRSLPAQARHLASDVFATDAPAPVDIDVSQGWNTADGGALVVMGLVWPHGRGTRSTQWRIVKVTTAMDTGFVETTRDWGLTKRSEQVEVHEPELAQRLQDCLEQAWSQAL